MKNIINISKQEIKKALIESEDQTGKIKLSIFSGDEWVPIKEVTELRKDKGQKIYPILKN